MKIAINGLGRIGRSILRQMSKDNNFDIVFLNDPKITIENLAYLLKYDSTYGRFSSDICTSKNSVIIDNKKIIMTAFLKPTDFLNNLPRTDCIVDTTGIRSFGKNFKKLILKNFTKKVIFTYSNTKFANKSIIVGVNDENYNAKKDHIISGTICDVISLSPIISSVSELSKIKGGNIVTLHPWLSYQNLVDGPVSSVNSPGNIWPDFALGRASSLNLLPKDTTALEVLSEIFPDLPYQNFQSMSFRVPTPTVTCGIINLEIETKININEFHENLSQNCNVEVIEKNLVSTDYQGLNLACSVDSRWTKNTNGNLRIISWYDNEFGYSSQIINLTKRILN